MELRWKEPASSQPGTEAANAGGGGARAQFMFEVAAGQRVTLYLGAIDAAGTGETAFRYAREGPAPSFYWVDQGFGYALTGALPREALLALATAVHRQLL